MEMKPYLDRIQMALTELENYCGGFKPDESLHYASGGLGLYQREEIKHIMRSLDDVQCCVRYLIMEGEESTFHITMVQHNSHSENLPN